MDRARMRTLGEHRSEIRELFEYGMRRKAEIGADHVFDFSIGNPSIPTPPTVTATLQELLAGDPLSLHGYTSAAGDPAVRAAVADDLNRRFGTAVGAEHLYLTCGAAASLTIALSALVEDGQEVIVPAPYFPEYPVFIQTAGGVPVTVAGVEPNFDLNLEGIAAAITDKTAAIILNSPNNPSGVVYRAEQIEHLADLLRKAQRDFGHPIYLIADEPYRELVYDGVTVPFLPKYYENTIVCYSYSKSISLPGERIGYLLVNPACEDWPSVYASLCGAGRALGFVCAPALFQRLLPHVAGQTGDLSIYKRNRDLLCGALTEMGFTVVRPDGAFYLFVKSPLADARAFSEAAKKYELLLVPSDSFGVLGYLRISYCVDTDTIRRALPAFEQLAKEFIHE